MTIDDLIEKLAKYSGAGGKLICARGRIVGVHVEYFKNDEITRDKESADILSVEFSTK
jgi:hypothetical protein